MHTSAAAAGAELKRLLTGTSLRFRQQPPTQPHWSIDALDDAEAFRKITCNETAQLMPLDDAEATSMVVLDIDHLDDPDGSAWSSELAPARLCAAVHLWQAVLSTVAREIGATESIQFSVVCHSGSKGLHAFAPSALLGRAARCQLADGLPVKGEEGAWLAARPARGRLGPLLERLRGVVLGCAGGQAGGQAGEQADVPAGWLAALRAASGPAELLALLLPTADLGPLRAGSLRAPLSRKKKGPLSTPLAWPCTVAAAAASWSPSAAPALTEAHLAVLRACPTPAPRRLVSEPVSTGPVERAAPVDVKHRLETGKRAARASDVPSWLPEAAQRALLAGVRRGGAPPAAWIAEPGWRRTRVPAGWEGRPLLLAAMCPEVELDLDDLPYLVRCVVATDFPADAAVAGLLTRLPDGRKRLQSYLDSASKGRLTSKGWSYSSGRCSLPPERPAWRVAQLDRAAELCKRARGVRPRGAGGCPAAADGEAGPSTDGEAGPKRRRLAADGADGADGVDGADGADGEHDTGRVVTIDLPPEAEVRARVAPLLEARADADAAKQGAKPREEILQDKTRHLDSVVSGLYSHAKPGDGGHERVVHLIEYVDSGDRLAYRAETAGVPSFAAVKSMPKDLKHLIFEGCWTADLSRAHMSSLVGNYQRMVSLGEVPPNEIIRRLHEERERVEEEIREELARTEPLARKRVAEGREHADALLKLTQAKPKVVLSRCVNHHPGAWRECPRVHSIVQAMQACREAAQRHPLVGRPADGEGRLAREAAVFEREAVRALVDCAQHGGRYVPLITINDELVFKPAEGRDVEDLRVLKNRMEAYVRRRLGFGLSVKLERVRV